jgi:hypothetical protein
MMANYIPFVLTAAALAGVFIGGWFAVMLGRYLILRIRDMENRGR